MLWFAVVPLGPSDRLEPVAGRPFDGIPLTPEDFYVLSRIRSGTRVSELEREVGLPGDLVVASVSRLIEFGLVEVGAGALPRPPGDRRQGVEDRRKERLAAALRGAGAPAAGRSTGARDARPEPRAAAPSPVPASEDPPLEPARLGEAPLDDSRLDPELDVPIDEQRRLLWMVDRLNALTAFELLGIAPTDDEREIRRGYFETSRRLHPDRFFGRNVGAFRGLLEELFKRLQRAQKELMDPAIRERHLQPLLQERAARAEAAAREAHARAQEEARAAAEEVSRRERELEERRLRDEDRRRRSLERSVSAVQQRARELFRQGEAAEREGKWAAAANAYRLAREVDPAQPEYGARWEAAVTRARAERARQAFARAEQLRSVGHGGAAAQSYLEAAQADPTWKHLSFAAGAVADSDAAAARDLAVRALEAVRREQSGGATIPPGDVALVHAHAAVAFAAAGQGASAREQAATAKGLAPEHPEVRGLLKGANLA